MRQSICTPGMVLVLAAVLLATGGNPVLTAPAPTPIRIAMPQATLFDSGLPVYVAQVKGFYSKAGLDAEIINTKGGGDNVQTVVAGSADIGLATGPFAVMAAYAQGAPVRIIASEMTGIDIFWFARGDSPYRSYKDLAGRKVGYSEPGSSSELALRALNRLLTSQGLKEVMPQAVGSPPDQLAAVKTGQIAAGFSAPVNFLDQVEKGDLRIIFKGTDLEEYRHVTVRVHFAHAIFARAHPAAVSAFLAADKMARDFLFSNRDEAMQIWHDKAQQKLDVAFLKKVYDYYTPDQLQHAPINNPQKILEDAVAFKFLKAPLGDKQAKDLFALQYLPK